MSFLRRQIRQYWLYRLFHTRSIAMTRTIARRYGELFGFVYVGGYPRSGTTWMARLVGHYLDLPFPQDSALPLAFRCVVHHHWRHEPAFDRSIHVIRDGRDVMVSEFVSMMQGMQMMRERRDRFGDLSVAEKAMLLRFGRDARLAAAPQRHQQGCTFLRRAGVLYGVGQRPGILGIAERAHGHQSLYPDILQLG